MILSSWNRLLPNGTDSPSYPPAVNLRAKHVESHRIIEVKTLARLAWSTGVPCHTRTMTIFRHRVSGPGSGGDIWVSTMHSSSVSGLTAVHGAWEFFISTFCSSTMNAMWNTHQSATTVVTDQLDPVTYKNVAQASSAITEVGTGTGGTPSPRTCMVIGLRTAVPTKAGRGRMYWQSPDDSHFTTGGAYATADCTTVANAFASGLTGFRTTATPIIFHRRFGTFDTITKVTVGDIPGTQRRRTNKDPVIYESAPI